MRIAISGTHGSGKSTLIADYLAVRPHTEHIDDPYTYLDDAADPPGVEEYVDEALSQLDLLVVLPLEHHNPIVLSEHEDLELRDAMNDALLELVDSCALAPVNRVTEIVGSRDARLATLLREIDTRTGLRVPDQ